MKKIINGKRYDTDTAKCVGEYWNGLGVNDFSHIYEDLYKKKTGEFFLHGQGGPMTKYAEACGQNSWSGGERIMPMTYKEAQKWAEDHLDGDEYESIFGEVLEDGEKVITTLSLSQKTHEMLKRKASDSGMTMSEYIESLI